MKIHDATGFICYKREVLAEIDLNKIKFVGYAFQIEMKYRTFVKVQYCRSANNFTDRTKGESKMSNSIIVEAVLDILRLKN
jgi:dolichol-phosphate mannosyltransferase